MSDFGAIYSAASQLPGTDYVLNQQKEMLNNLTIQGKTADVSAQPMHLELLKAQIANEGALGKMHSSEAVLKEEQARQAQVASQKLQEYQSQQQAVQAKAAADPLSPQSTKQYGGVQDSVASAKIQANQLVEMGNFLTMGGAPMEGKKYLDQGMSQLTKISTIEKNSSQQRTAQLTAAQKEVDLTAQFLGSARSPAEFEAGKAALLAAMPEMPAEDRQRLIQTQYTPDVIKHINDSAMTAKARADLVIKQEDLKSKEADRASAMQDRVIRRDTAHIEEAEAARERGRQKVTGGKAEKAPSTAEVKSAEGAVRRSLYPGAGDDKGLSPEQKDQVQNAAAEVLLEKQRLMANNRGLSPVEAETRAVAKVRRDIVPVQEKTFMHPISGETKQKFMDGKTPETAKPIAADTNKVVGTHYNVKGKPYTWNGKFLIPDQQAAQ